MKRVRHIFIVLLSLVLFHLGAGVAFIHICSSHCRMEQACGGHTHTKKSCCASKPEAGKQVDTLCQCMTLSYQADFYPGTSQQVLPQVASCYMLGYSNPVVLALLVSDNKSVSEMLAHAPPFLRGRDRLAFHSVLII